MKLNKGTFMMYGSLLATVSFIVLLIFELPPFLIDLCLVLSMAAALLIYLKATSIKSWYEFKTFPTLLLFIFVFRISLNIATTRKILTDGQPGHVIEEFGNFVIGGNPFVGFVVFLILIIFQFIIANGSSRTGEVTARFTLDALPGKQMTIDAEVSQKIITPEEAQKKRKMLKMETDFYGAMDGAGKFIKGDVIFGIASVLVNLIFGLIVGVVTQGMPVMEAVQRYTLLTIGDGIVNQIASLLIALATGILLVNVFDEDDEKSLPQGIYSELTKSGIIVNALGILLILIGLFTQLPALPFISIGVFMIVIGIINKRNALQKEEEDREKRKQEIDELQEQQPNDDLSKNVTLKKGSFPIVVKVGVELVPLIKMSREGYTIKDKIETMRRTLTEELGIKIPFITIVDNAYLNEDDYVIEIKGAKVTEGTLKTNHMFALKTAVAYEPLQAEPGIEPVYMEPGYWIEESMIQSAKDKNYRILDPLNMLIHHLEHTLKRNVHELITRQQVKDLIDSLEEENSVLLDEIQKKNVDLSLIQSVIQKLLKERISIQDLPEIITAIIDGNTMFKGQVDLVTSLVRERISRYICENIKDEDGKINIFLLEEEFEKEAKVETSYDGYYISNIGPMEESVMMEKLADAIKKCELTGIEPALLVRRKDLRFGMVRLVQKYGIDIPILCVDELVPDVTVENIGTI